ncbi:prolactin-releasing peptide receptor-like [Brachionus plicatilis]|uniref:Prolactin-releasing peptide receptor-like n=1 Tax=Brachionus plicatilis TaxID=10195 RepID=A0A3M7S277_BRAPC|nr:prolactin-releasing peptide receptor-like [Brachionus plicatilis]
MTSSTIQNLVQNPANGTYEEIGEEHSRLTIIILGTLYSLIFFIGVTGNSLVVYVVCVKKSMQSVTNLFIMNLALSDILMCLLAVPFTPISFFQEYWILGKFLCHLVSFSLGVSVYVSTLTSLAIAIDRYFVIVHPFKPRMKLGVCCLLIAVVWIISISISLPLAVYIELIPENVNGEIKSKCRESWPIPMSKRFFNLASMVLQYLIPFTVITYSYTKIWLILSNRTRPGKTKEKEQLELKRKKRTNRMLIAMVIIFAGCWMPLNCVHLIMEFNINFTKQSYFSNVFFIAHVIAMSSTIYNPFLYAWLNDNFRKEFRLILPWIFRAIKWCNKSDNVDAINEEESNIEFSKYLVNQVGIEQIEMTSQNGHKDSTNKKHTSKYDISLNLNKQMFKASKSKEKLNEEEENGTLDQLI